MEERLTALPVAGDSFLLRRNGLTILVDSGGSGKVLARLLRNLTPPIERIDIAVCTHADRDHAGGLTSLLEHWHAAPSVRREDAFIGQFWLPGAWEEVIPDLLVDAKKVADALVVELDNFAAEYPDLAHQDRDSSIAEDDLDQHNRQVRVKQVDGYRQEADTWESIGGARSDDLFDFSESGAIQMLRSQIEQIMFKDAGSARALDTARQRVRYRLSKRRIGFALAHYWLLLIATADRIRRIALAAIKHKIRIRWFDYGRFQQTGRASGGIPGLLVPVNAVQLLPQPTGFSYSKILRLSIFNEQCLSFYAPDSRSWPSVLFCGDSPMGSGQRYSVPFPLPRHRFPWPTIATAPHHGADSNSIAYQHIKAWAGTDRMLWLRSGGASNHPETAYRNLPAGRRFCTNCPHLKLSRAFVDITFEISHSLPLFTFCVSGYRCRC